MSEGAIVQIIVTLITVCIPAVVTLVSSKSLRKQAKRHASRQSILQLIMEDKISVMEGKLPENHQAILDEYTVYSDNGGNKYVHRKIDEYEDWYKRLTKRKDKDG